MGTLPLQIFNDVKTARAKLRKQNLEGELLVEGGVRPIVNDEIERSQRRRLLEVRRHPAVAANESEARVLDP